jgi:hypothetical protein
MDATDDDTLLVFRRKYDELISKSPESFGDSIDVLSYPRNLPLWPTTETHVPISITKQGLRIEAPLIRENPESEYPKGSVESWALLRCVRLDKPYHFLALPLAKHEIGETWYIDPRANFLDTVRLDV